MISNTKFMCRGADPQHATQCCFSSGCSEYCMLCPREECSCRLSHPNHSFKHTEDVVKLTEISCPVPNGYNNIKKSIKSTLGDFIVRLQYLEKEHDEYSETYMGLQQECAMKLRTDLLEGMSRATGDEIFRFLEQRQTQTELKSPYKLQLDQVEKQLARTSESLLALEEEIRHLWQQNLKFKETAIQNGSLDVCAPLSTKVLFEDCQCADWPRICSRLFDNPKESRTGELGFWRCDLGDSLNSSIEKLVNLRKLTLGTCILNRVRCNLSEVEWLFPLTTLSELDVGDNRKLTQGMFKAVILQLPALEELRFPLSLTEFGMIDKQLDDRAIRLICSNLEPTILKKLFLVNNKITEKGAATISQRLLYVEELHIQNNRIGSEGAISLLRDLHKLKSLSIKSNDISDGCIDQLAKLILQQKSLTDLYIGSNFSSNGNIKMRSCLQKSDIYVG